MDRIIQDRQDRNKNVFNIVPILSIPIQQAKNFQLISIVSVVCNGIRLIITMMLLSPRLRVKDRGYPLTIINAEAERQGSNVFISFFINGVKS